MHVVGVNFAYVFSILLPLRNTITFLGLFGGFPGIVEMEGEKVLEVSVRT